MRQAGIYTIFFFLGQCKLQDEQNTRLQTPEREVPSRREEKGEEEENLIVGEFGMVFFRREK